MVSNANFDKTDYAFKPHHKRYIHILSVQIPLCIMNMDYIDYNWCMSKYHDISILYQGTATVIFFFVYK